MGGSSRRLHFFPSLGCGLPCWELLCRWPPPGFFPLPITAVLKGTADTGNAWGLLPTLCFAFFLAGLSIGWTFSFESASAASWAGREDLDSAGCTMVLLCGGEEHENEPEVQLPSVDQDTTHPSPTHAAIHNGREQKDQNSTNCVVTIKEDNPNEKAKVTSLVIVLNSSHHYLPQLFKWCYHLQIWAKSH